DYGGIAKVMPVYATLFMITMLASIGLPGLNGFVGEFLVLNGTFSSEILPQNAFAIFATIGVILAAVYMLWLYQRLMFGPIKHKRNEKLVDLNAREVGILVPLIILMVWIGIRPVDFTRYSEVQVEELLQSAQQKRVAVQQSVTTDALPERGSTLYEVTDELASQTKNK